jgi:hypothetical protein
LRHELWLSLGVPATIRAMRPTPAELEVARALIARVKAADPSIKRVDKLLVCAAVACRADELVAAPDFALVARAASLDREECARLLRHQFQHQFTGPENSGLPLSTRGSVYSRQTEAGVARALISTLKAAEFLAPRRGCWPVPGALRARALSVPSH